MKTDEQKEQQKVRWLRWKARHPERYLEISRNAARRFRQHHPERVAETVRRYAANHPESVRRWAKISRDRALLNPRRQKAKLAYQRRWRKEHRLEQNAHRRVARALVSGKLVRPNTCSRCGKTGRIEAHHHHGYKKPYQLDVLWLCCTCHVAFHP